MNIAVIEEDLSVKSGSRRLIYYSTRILQEQGHNVKIFAKRLDQTTCFPEMLTMPVELIESSNTLVNRVLKKVVKRNVDYYWSYAREALDMSKRIADWEPDVAVFHYTGELWLPPYFYYLERPIGLVCFHVIPRGVPPFPRLSLTGKVGQIIFNAPPLGKKNAVGQSKIGAVITHSSFMNEQILRIGKISAARKHVIPLGVDHSVFFPADEEESFALYLGRIHPQKGLELLIKAMEKTSSDHSLVIAGDLARDFLWYKDKLLALAEQANLSSRISIVEAPTSTQLVRLMQRCAVFLFPSQVDTFGLVVLEAMACGKPVIACKAGGVSELLGDSGLLIEADPQLWQETLGRLMKDSNLRRKLGSDALKRSMKYSWESTTNSMLGAFSDLLHSDKEGEQA